MSEQVESKKVTVTNPQGLHARPADLLVRLATQFESTIEIVKENEVVDGKSILSLLTLAAGPGTELDVRAKGPDASRALQAIAQLFKDEFAEQPADEA